jgi:hypothetical protein
VSTIHKGRVTVGLVILAAGLVMFLDRTGAIHADVGRLFAPSVLIALGLVRVVDGWHAGDPRRHPLTGFWLIAIGVWMLVSDFHVFGLSYQTSWPLLIVAMGLVLVLQELTGARRAVAAAAERRESSAREEDR